MSNKIESMKVRQIAQMVDLDVTRVKSKLRELGIVFNSNETEIGAADVERLLEAADRLVDLFRGAGAVHVHDRGVLALLRLDLAHGGADQFRDLVIRELGLRGDLAPERHVLALDLDLDREARVRVNLEVAVEKVGGDVVRDLVGVAEGDPSGCLQHGCRLCGCSEVVEGLETCVSARVRTLS